MPSLQCCHQSFIYISTIKIACIVLNANMFLGLCHLNILNIVILHSLMAVMTNYIGKGALLAKATLEAILSNTTWHEPKARVDMSHDCHRTLSMPGNTK